MKHLFTITAKNLIFWKLWNGKILTTTTNKTIIDKTGRIYGIVKIVDAHDLLAIDYGELIANRVIEKL